MTCTSCGQPASGRKCKQCELAERFEADDPSTFESSDDEDAEIRADGAGEMATNERAFDGDANAAALIHDVSTLVDGDRDSHGDAVQQQEAAAEAWTWYLRIHGFLASGARIHGSDVARMMELLKISRGGVGEYDLDHDRDAVGYAGIAGACAVYEGDADREDLTRGDAE